MRLLIEMNNCDFIELNKIQEGLEKVDIEKVWTIYDEKEMWDSCKFNPYTGRKVETLDDLILSHQKGVFIEDAIHDWMVSKGLFKLYSRFFKDGAKVKVIIETTIKL